MRRILTEFLERATPWQIRMIQIMEGIPFGILATYGDLAEMAGNRNGARSVGALRRTLYGLLGHESAFPLHRICSKGDVGSWNDSEETREVNNRLRGREGSLTNPRWIGGE